MWLFQAMVKLGVPNSRMKDFYDIWMLSRTFDFRGELLSKAVSKTFESRKTPITTAPSVFDPLFAKESGKKIQWQGFITKAKLVDAPEAFEDVVAAVKIFLEPPVISRRKMVALKVSPLVCTRRLLLKPGKFARAGRSDRIRGTLNHAAVQSEPAALRCQT